MEQSRTIQVVLLALLVLFLTSTTRAVQTKAPTAFPSFSIAFIGNSVVDLMWDPAPGSISYRRDRNPGASDTVTPETIDGRLFYHDTQATGIDLQYRICAVFTSDETCSDWQMVHVGQVQGNLYKDLTWRDAVIELDGPVVINKGVVLRVTDRADVLGYRNVTGCP